MTPSAAPSGEDNHAILLKDVAFAWPRGDFRLDIDRFEVSAGERVLLLGESGSGKSTLLSLICGILLPASGLVQVAGQDLSKLSPSQRDRYRADRIGVIFQMFNLLPYASALDNILLPLRFSPARRARCSDQKKDALALTTALGLPESLVQQGSAADLSVGQQQRVAVARAMIGRPDLIVADEPTSALDAGSQREFLDLLFSRVSAANSSLVMVSHDDRIADRFDRVLSLSDIARSQRAVPA
ncbi:MAG: ATP-binding cassette domain-containing protein [Rhodobacteraceae bacterium]|nr:ATP-binding cassette domain-containing protein [Paracoccaceae bacterium]